ncbi:MAG: carboxypeptidase-like regulatory domain-containing protein [Flammeovirgaceae bacterium]
MRKILLLFWLYAIPSSFLFAQDCLNKRVFSGVMKGENGEALLGATILIEGTSRGTTADIDGKYTIVTCLGDVVVLKYVGFSDQKIVVTDKNSEPFLTGSTNKKASKLQKNRPKYTQKDIPKLYERHTNPQKLSIKDFVQDTTQQVPTHKKGAANLNQDAYQFGFKYKGYDYKSLQYYGAPASIKKHKNGTYTLEFPGYTYEKSRFLLDFNSWIQFDEVGRQPPIQSRYAQGRSEHGELTWKGPQDNEVFSWGPLRSELEYDGVPTPFDANGSLVPAFTGTGQAPLNTSGVDAFLTAFTRSNAISVSTRVRGGEFHQPNYFQVTYRNVNKRNLLVENNDFNQHHFNLKGHFKLKQKLEFEPQFHYRTTDNAPFQGGVLTNILASQFLTPSTFDNANGVSLSDAPHTPTSFQLSDGSPRSFAPQAFDNPFWLIGRNPNVNEDENWAASIKLMTDIRNSIRVSYQFGFDAKIYQEIYGISPQSATYSPGRLTSRREEVDRLNSLLTVDYDIPEIWPFEVDAKLTYQWSNDRRRLDRSDGFEFPSLALYTLEHAGRLTETAIRQGRLRNELGLNVSARYKYIANLSVIGNVYHSSTIDRSRFLPTVGAALNVHELFDMGVIDQLRFYGNLTHNIKEAELAQNNFAFNSTQQSIQEALNFFPQQELFIPTSLKPERIQNYEIGMTLGLFNNQLSLDATFYRNMTSDAIYPIGQNNEFQLQNVGTIVQNGLELSFDYFMPRRYSDKKLKLYISGLLVIDRPEVKSLNLNEERVPIGGFQEVSTNLIAGEPLGVIVGTDYLKDAAGQLVIGADGFPIMDTTPQIIGNPNPRFTGAITPKVTWRGFSFSMNWTFRHGGDQWNGTQQALDYYGKSEQTANERATRNYLFEGVLMDGSPNTTLVDFYNPANDITENRWVRYGLGGVGKAYIQNASWFRLNEIQLSYHLSNEPKRNATTTKKTGFKKFLRTATISLYARNLFLMTSYTGVDPESALFGYAGGRGLDFFNAPTMNQFGARIHIQL